MESSQSEKEPALILAVSGGPDSMCLLVREAEAAQKDGRMRVVAHVNYGLRASATADAAFVQEWAAHVGFPCETRNVTEEERSARKGNLEAWARELRYAFFETILEKYDAESVLIAHTANDQAETVLMRMLQGTGLRGCAGMRAEISSIKRPLLTWRRQDVLNFLKEREIPFQTDETNNDVSFLRNRIRHKVVPLLEGKDAQVVEKLCVIATQAQKALAELAIARDAWLAQYSQQQKNEWVVEKEALQNTPQLLKHELLRTLTGLSGRQSKEERELERFLTEAKNGSSRTLSNGLQVYLRRGTVAFCSPQEKRAVEAPAAATYVSLYA